eukprot:scaffold23593_cov72-Phaeocystis_antarctica.AAC.2
MEASRANTSGEAQPQQLRLCTTVNYFTCSGRVRAGGMRAPRWLLIAGQKKKTECGAGICRAPRAHDKVHVWRTWPRERTEHMDMPYASPHAYCIVSKCLGAKRGATLEGIVADVDEAIGQAGQSEGGAVVEGAVADAGEAVK